MVHFLPRVKGLQPLAATSDHADPRLWSCSHQQPHVSPGVPYLSLHLTGEAVKGQGSSAMACLSTSDFSGSRFQKLKLNQLSL